MTLKNNLISKELSVKEFSNLKTNVRTELTPAKVLCDLLLFGHFGKLDKSQKEQIQKINSHLSNISNMVLIQKNFISECQYESVVDGTTTFCIRKKGHNGKCIFADPSLIL